MMHSEYFCAFVIYHNLIMILLLSVIFFKISENILETSEIIQTGLNFMYLNLYHGHARLTASLRAVSFGSITHSKLLMFHRQLFGD